MKKLKLSFPKLLLSILFCQLAGVIGSFFTISAIPSWYATLNKPFFNPPNWLFGPVWILLYLLMGISFYLIWSENKQSKQFNTAVAWFVIQLVLNAIWSIIFFGLRLPLLAFFEILALWIAIVFTMKSFRLLSRPASLLFFPYLAWVSFAIMLNLVIVLLN